MPEQFELLTQLGRAGVGVVWTARDTATGEIVASQPKTCTIVTQDYYGNRSEAQAYIFTTVKVATQQLSPDAL